MKKLFGKRGIALLTTLALLVSLVAMLSGLSVTSNAAYSPKRTMSITAGGTQIEGKILMYQTAEILGANKDIVVKGYYKVDGYVAKNDTDHNVQIAPDASAGAASVKADCDWTAFEAQWNTGAVNTYHVLKFGFWYAQGTMSLADIVIEDTEGNVLYDFATDASLPAGDVTGAVQHGFWYFGFYGEQSEFSGHIDEAVAPVHQPKRTMSITAGGTQIEGKILMYQTAEILGANKDIVIKGYYKVDGYVAKNDTDHNVQIAPDASVGAASVKADCDWTPFTAQWNTGAVNTYHVLKFGFWYAQGTMSLADIVIEDTEGNVLYDFTTDTNMPAGDVTGAVQHGFWYFGFYGEQSEFSGHIDEVYEAPAYQPKRVISMTTAGTQINGKANLYNSDLLGSDKNVTVKGYYKVENYTVANETQNPHITMGSAKVTADCDWTPFEMDIVTGVGHKVCFEFWYTQGTLSFADVTITEGDTVIYDMTTDTELVAGTYTPDNWDTQHGMWYFGYYGALSESTYTIGEALEGEQPEKPNCTTHHTWGEDNKCEICGTDRPTYDVIEGDTNYVPKRVISVTGRPGAIEAKILIIGSGTQFGNGKIYIVKGKYKIENYDQAVNGSGHNVQIGICDNAAGGVSVKGNTNGWVDFEVRYMTSDAGGAWLKFGHWYTFGTVSLADVTFEDTNGNVVYEMATDETLSAGQFGPEYTDDDSMWLPKYGEKYGMWYLGYWAGGDAKDACSGTIDPVYVPCADGHNFVDGTCTECGAADPDYVPPVDDPCADGHNFVDGTCTDCGAADPDYVEPPAQTGDYSMIVFAAMGMMSAAGASALVLNKKKFTV